MYQHKDFAGTEKILNKDFENISEWFVDNKLSIYFAGEINSFRKSVKGWRYSQTKYKIQRNKYKATTTSDIS